MKVLFLVYVEIERVLECYNIFSGPTLSAICCIRRIADTFLFYIITVFACFNTRSSHSLLAR